MKEQDLIAKLSAQLPYYSVADNERKTDQCVQIAKDYAEQEAIEFAMSISTHCYCELGNDTRSYKELYQLFKNRENER